jgi:hypothetical protein
MTFAELPWSLPAVCTAKKPAAVAAKTQLTIYSAMADSFLSLRIAQYGSLKVRSSLLALASTHA